MQLSYRVKFLGVPQVFWGLFRCLRKPAQPIRGYENPTRCVEAVFVLQHEHKIRGPSIVEHILATAEGDLIGHAEQDVLGQVGDDCMERVQACELKPNGKTLKCK